MKTTVTPRQATLRVLLAVLSLSFVVTVTTAAKAQSDTRGVTLVRDGIPVLPIISGSVEAPVAELREYLQQITGADFPAERAEPGKPGIHVGLARDFPWLTIYRGDELGPEGFVLQTDEDSMYLIAAQPQGVQHAVTTFLHRLGCRWFFPGDAWEVVPARRTIVGQWNERHVPAFPTQRHIWYGFGAYAGNQRDLANWERHNRMGGVIHVSIGHTWHGLNSEKDFAEHPEWFALVEGERRATKPCYSHPQVLRRAIASALEQAELGEAMISQSPPDGLGYCECDRCLSVFNGSEPFRAHNTLFARRSDGKLVNVTSETLFAFINKVAAAVAEKHPQTLIGCYAYSAYSHPPSFELHPNVYLQTTTAFRRTPVSLEEQLAAFGDRTNQLGIREYYSVYQWDWDYPSPGKLSPSQLSKDLTFYHRHGVTAVNAEASNNWAARGLGYYVASQLMWDLEVDVKEFIREFYQQAFGPAAVAMQRYYARWYGPDVVVLRDDRETPELSELYKEGELDVETLQSAYRDLDEAVASVAADSPYRKRIDLLRMYAHYLFLRYELHKAEKSGQRSRILDAIRAETVFGGRLTNTNMIHSRPLIGKAFLRRFKQHEGLLADVDEAQQANQGWRQIGSPPTQAELDMLWAADKSTLGIR